MRRIWDFMFLTWLALNICTGCSPAFWQGVSQGLQDGNATESNQSGISTGQTCPSCGMRMYFTGETRTEWGKLLQMYKCPAGHDYWFTSSTRSTQSITRDPCPICGMGMHFTGQTKIEWGRLLKIYECPAGHQAVKQ